MAKLVSIVKSDQPFNDKLMTKILVVI